MIERTIGLASESVNRVLNFVGVRVVRNRGSIRASMRWLRSHSFAVRTVLDVGASDGRWTKECRRFGFPDAAAILFEPNPAHHHHLAKFIQSQSRCQARHAAVSNQVGQGEFNFAKDAMGGSLGNPHAKPNEDSVYTVEVTTLDREVADLNLTGPFLIKLDTHGFVREILQGAIQTLQHTNVLVIEGYTFEIQDDSPLFWQLCGYLHEAGFRCIDIVDPLYRPHDDAFWQADFIFVNETWDGFRHKAFR